MRNLKLSIISSASSSKVYWAEETESKGTWVLTPSVPVWCLIKPADAR